MNKSNHKAKVACWIGYCKYNSLNTPSLQGMFYCTLDEVKIEAVKVGLSEHQDIVVVDNTPVCKSFERL
jgi:hypothetical protein